MRFEPFTEHHLPAIDALLEDPDVLRFTRVPVPVPEGFGRTWLTRYEEGRLDGTREVFAALDDESGDVLGFTMAPRIDHEAREAELGYMVLPGARGRGAATEMLAWMTRWAFDELGLLRVELLIDVANAASLQVARHCGYFHEGTLRSAHHKSNIRIDVTIWSKLPTDE